MKLTSSSSVSLDLIRAISAQLVFVGHLLSFYQIYGGNPNDFLMQQLGVLVFFMLSGFLISYSISNKTEDYTYKEFVIDRFARIFIAFIPALFVIAGLDLLSNKLYGSAIENMDVRTFIGNVLMLQDFPHQSKLLIFGIQWDNITSLGTGRPLWTVAIEWWIYLFFGFVMLKKRPYNVLSILAFCFLLYVPIDNVFGKGDGLSIVWFTGALIFYLLKRNFLGQPKETGVVIFVLLVACASRLYFNNHDFYDTGFGFLLVTILFLSLVRTQSRPISILLKFRSPVNTLAAYSFSLYLLHYTIIVFVMNMKLGMNKWAEMALIFIGGNILSYLFAQVTEYKYNQFRIFLKAKML
jgi:peptidoglycan/LPS O-acetylase OafA/YrhL